MFACGGCRSAGPVPATFSVEGLPGVIRSGNASRRPSSSVAMMRYQYSLNSGGCRPAGPVPATFTRDNLLNGKTLWRRRQEKGRALLQHNRPGMLSYRMLAGGALLAYSPVALLRAVTGRRRPGDIGGRLGWK